MSSASYSPVVKTKQFTCVQQESLYTLAGVYIPSGPSAVQGTFNNTLTQPLTVTISVAAGGTIGTGGPSFNLSGGNLSYLVTVSFNRKYSGKIEFSANSLDNSPTTGFVSKICNSSIGNPDILDANVEVIGNCLQAVLNNPTNPKVFGWSEVNETTSFTFLFTRIFAADTLNLELILNEKSFAKWEKDFVGTTPVWTDPITNTQYTPTLPAGVYEVTCEEDNETASYTQDLCYKIGSSISFDMSSSPAEPWDAYNGIRPRIDGIPFLTHVMGGQPFYEFDATGKYLYTISGITLGTHSYTGFNLSGFAATPINFLGFPAAGGYTPVGIAVHPTTGTIYVMYMSGTRNLFLATLINNILTLVGDCQFLSAITPFHDAHDITFTKSGQLVMAHGDKIYLVDDQTGVINSGAPITIVGASTFVTSIRNITRYGNGDLHFSGTDSSLGPIVIIYDGETYTSKGYWTSASSTTPPDSTISIAYPKDPTVKFKRLYIKNIETNLLSIDDRDIVTGQQLSLPLGVEVFVCEDTVPNEVSWTESLCYVLDKNVISQGIINLTGNQLNTDAACNPIGGFVPPPAVTLSTFTHNLAGNGIYAVNTVGPNLEFYTWTVASTPTFFSSVLLTGFTGVIKSIRTRWSDNTIWIMTERTAGSVRIFDFYSVNTASGVCLLKNSATYPAGAFNNAHFTWGVDGIAYMSYNLGGGIYRISKLLSDMYIGDFVADVPYVIDNINTDLPNQRLILSKTTAGLDFLSYTGNIVEENCGAVITSDAIHAPLTNFKVGASLTKIKKIYIKDLVTGEVRSSYHDFLTGNDVSLPPFARVIDCNNAPNAVTVSVPRAQLVTGLNSWSKNINAPNAKTVTLTRVANIVNISDGLGGFNVNVTFTMTWTADKLGGNLVFTGGAAGSSFIVNWIE